MATAVHAQDDHGIKHEERPLETSPPRCYGCGKVISDSDVIEVLNGIFHRNCFSCQFCRRRLEIDGFGIEDGRPCCDPHCSPTNGDARPAAAENELNGSPRIIGKKEYCYSCGRVIEGRDFVQAFDGIFHSQCFRCQNCQKLLSVGACTVLRGRLHCNPLCEMTVNESTGGQQALQKYTIHQSGRSNEIALKGAQYFETGSQSDSRRNSGQWNHNQSLPLCFVCGEPTLSWDRLESNRQVFHRNCFRCHLCNQPLFLPSVQWNDGVPCCYPNCLEYRQARSADPSMYVRTRSLSNPISRASKPISFVPTEKVPELNRKSYESVPASLGVSQNDLTVYDGSPLKQSKRPEPNRRTDEEMNHLCYYCGKKVYAMERLHILSRIYHRRCFRCGFCNRILDIGRYSVHDGSPYCIPHHQSISRNRSASTTNLDSRYSEPEIDRHSSKHDDQTDIRTDQPPWMEQQLTRSQTAPVLSYQRAPIRSAPEQRRARSPSSPAPSSKMGAIPFVDIDLRTTATASLATSKSSLQRIEPGEVEERYCFTCGRAVHPYLRIALPDKVFHPDCAKCYICQIGLSLSNYRDFDGKLYCSPHYAQALAEFIEYRQKSSVTSPQKTSLLGFAGITNQVSSPIIVNTQAWPVNARGPATIEEPSPRTIYVDRSSRQHTEENVSLLSNTLVDLPQIPPRPKQITSNPVMQLKTIQPVRDRSIVNQNSGPQESSVCMICEKPLLPATYIKLSGKSIHLDCLRCQSCGIRLNQTTLNEHDGKIYCATDYSKLTEGRTTNSNSENMKLKTIPVSPLNTRRMPTDKSICFSCGKKVYVTESLYVMERVYHKQCFKCMKCNGTLSVENYHVWNGQPYCRSHYKELMYNSYNDSNRVQSYTIKPETRAITQYEAPQNLMNFEPVSCQICQNVVHPRDGIHIAQQYYHYDCFTCAHCKQKLNVGKFEMVQGKAYCSDDFLRLFGRNRGSSSRQSLTNLNEVAQNRANEMQRTYSFRNSRSLVSRQTS